MSGKARRRISAVRAEAGAQVKPRPDSLAWLDTARLVALIIVVAAVFLLFLTRSDDQGKIKTTIFYIGTALLGTAWLIPALITGRMPLVRSRITLPAAAIIVFGGLSLLLFPYKETIWSEAGRRLAYFVMYLVVIHTITNRSQLKWFGLSMLMTAVPIVIYGFSQHFDHDLLGISWAETANVQLRIISTLGNATYLAAYLAILIPAAVAYFLLTENRIGAVFTAVAMAGMQICLVWTWSRGPWAGLAVGLFVSVLLLAYVFREKMWQFRYKIPIAIAILILATLAGSYKTDVLRRAQSATAKDLSNVQRTCQWNAAYAVFRENPALGAGVGATTLYVTPHLTPAFYATSRDVVSGHAHNEFLEILAEGGIVQALLFLWLWLEVGAVAVGTARRGARKDDKQIAVVSIALLGGMIAFLLANIGGLTMRCTYGGMMFWIVVGLVAVCRRIYADANPDELEKDRAVVKQLPVSAPLRDSLIPPVIALVILVTHFSVAFLKADVLMKSASNYMNKGDWISAEEDLRKSVNYNKHSVLGHYRLANSLAAQGRFEEALARTKVVSRLAPDYARIHAYKASVLRTLRRYDEAKPEALRAIKIDGLPASYAELSRIQEDQGQYALSLKTLRHAYGKLKNMTEGDDRLWRTDAKRLVSLQLKVHPDEDPAEALQDILPADARSTVIRNAIGDHYRLAGDWARAEKALLNATSIDPDNDLGLDLLGYVYFQQHKYPQALSAYLTEADLTAAKEFGQTRHLNALLNSVEVAIGLGDRQTAGTQYTKLVQAAPNSEQTQEAKRLLYGTP